MSLHNHGQQQKHWMKHDLKQIYFSLFLCFPSLDFCSVPYWGLGTDNVNQFSLCSRQQGCLMLLPRFHLSEALTKAFDCRNPNSLDSNPLLFKYHSLLTFFEAHSKHISALHSKTLGLYFCINAPHFEFFSDTELCFQWEKINGHVWYDYIKLSKNSCFSKSLLVPSSFNDFLFFIFFTQP